VRFLLTILSLGLAACSIAQTTPGPTAIPVVVPESRSSLVLLAEDGHTWCAYEHVAAFEAAVEKTRPTETARATFLADKLIELTHQIEAESGDWIVVDRYTPKDGGTMLRRASLLAQDDRQVIQEATIHAGKAEPFRMISVSTLNGKKAVLSPNADLPEVPVQTNLDMVPFVQLVVELRRQLVGQLCKKLN
jgi:hypothetical protein